MSGASIGMLELAHVKAQSLKRKFRQSTPDHRDRRDLETRLAHRVTTRALSPLCQIREGAK